MNLKLRGARLYSYTDKPEGDVIEAEVYYGKGGQNYFNGKTDARGFWLSLTPINIEVRPTSTTRSRMMFSGLKMFLSPAARYSDKALLKIVEEIDPLIPGMYSLLLDPTPLTNEQRFALAFDFVRNARAA